VSQVLQPELQGTKQLPLVTWQVAHKVLSQGSQVPSVCVNYPIIQEVQSPAVSHVVQLSWHGIVQFVAEVTQVPQTLWSQVEQLFESVLSSK